MRFITKQVEYSKQFYSIFSSFLSYDKFKEFLSNMSNFEKCKANIPSYQMFYEKHIKKNFNSVVLFNTEVKKIIFDNKYNINPFDDYIYSSLLNYTKRYIEIEKSLFRKIFENAKEIRNGCFSENIKELAKLNKHDEDIISIEFNQPYLKIIFNTSDGIRTYIFTLVDDWKYKKIDVAKLTDFAVGYEEIFENSNNTFEYNILIRDWKNRINPILEISIIFSDLKIEY